MAARSLIPRLTDIIEAIERIHSVLGDMPLDVFEIDDRHERRKRKTVTASKIAHTRSPPELTGFRRLCSVPSGGPLLAG